MSSRSSKKTSSEGGAAGRAGETVEVGRILGPHGVRGEVAVESFSDVADRFAPGRALRVLPRSGAPDRLIVETVRPHRGGLLIRFEGVADRDAAEPLRGALLEVGRSEVPEPPAGTYYYFQLLGCRVRDAHAGDLGAVVDLFEDGGGVLLVVDDGARRVPIPFVRAMVRRVMPAAGGAGDDAGAGSGLIELELPEGLLEACASKS